MTSVAPKVLRTSAVYSLRPEVQPPARTSSCLSSEEKQDNNKEDSVSRNSDNPTKKKSGGRPKEQEELHEWVKKRFNDMGKGLKFESVDFVLCSCCTNKVGAENLVMCHDMPFHQACLLETERVVTGE